MRFDIKSGDIPSWFFQAVLPCQSAKVPHYLFPNEAIGLDMRSTVGGNILPHLPTLPHLPHPFPHQMRAKILPIIVTISQIAPREFAIPSRFSLKS